MQADQRPGEPHKFPRPGATPGPAIFGRVRKLEKRSVRETGDFVGSTPTSATSNRAWHTGVRRAQGGRQNNIGL